MELYGKSHHKGRMYYGVAFAGRGSRKADESQAYESPPAFDPYVDRESDLAGNNQRDNEELFVDFVEKRRLASLTSPPLPLTDRFAPARTCSDGVQQLPVSYTPRPCCRRC